jgi:hypothetical protein
MLENKWYKRLLIVVCLAAAVVFLPWWVFLALVLLGGLFLNYTPYEYIVPGLVGDWLYSVPRESFHGFAYVYISMAVVAIVVSVIKHVFTRTV